MSGSYWLLDSPTDERALSVTLKASTRDLGEFVRKRTWLLEGTIEAERLASQRDLEGTLIFALIDERRIPYRIAFRGDDGRKYELTGQKEWSGFAPIESMTLLPATLLDERGGELGRATLRFDLRADWADWMKSFRLRLGNSP